MSNLAEKFAVWLQKTMNSFGWFWHYVIIVLTNHNTVQETQAITSQPQNNYTCCSQIILSFNALFSSFQFPEQPRKWLKYKNKLDDWMIKQLLNSVIAKYRDLSLSHGPIICLSLWLQEIIDLLTSDKSLYFAQPHPIIVNYM